MVISTPMVRNIWSLALLGSLSACATNRWSDEVPAPPASASEPVALQDESHASQAQVLHAPGRSRDMGFTLPARPAGAEFTSAVIDSDSVYGLAELIDLAQSSNPDTTIAWNEARNAALAAGIARSAYLPRISAAALAGRQRTDGNTSVAGLDSGAKNQYTGSMAVLSLDWLLFDFGKRRAVVDAADQDVVLANVRFTAAHQRIIHAVSTAFYAYSAIRARNNSVEQSLGDAKEILVAAQSRRKQGIGTVMEVAQAEQFVAQAEFAKVKAQGDLADAYVTLVTAVGLSPLTKIRIADISEQPLPLELDEPVDAVLNQALQHRPDVLAALAVQKAADAGIRSAEADFKPKVFLTAAGSRSSGGLDVSAVPGVGGQLPTVNISNHRWGSSVMVGVSIPLYTGGTRGAMLDQARHRADTAEKNLERVRLGAAREVVIADSRLRNSLSAVAAAQALLHSSRTSYEAAMAAYQHGVGTSTDTLAAERQLIEARNAVADAHSAALTAAATLALATGSLGSAPK